MALHLQNITKHYNDFVAVGDIDLTIETGELVSLLGPSGCGKTTTLQMIAGFTIPTHGTIVLNGEDITRKPAHQRGIGIMFQSYALFPHMTVFENVAFGLEMRKLAKDSLKKRVFEKLELVALTDHAQKYPSTLSGGQRQRVALARALVIEPPLLLLDEPLSALDAKIREDMQNELRQIQQHLNITTVMVTHDQAEALAISDKVAIMNQGKIEQVGCPVTVYDSPETEFVCTFLGRSNRIPCTIKAGTKGNLCTVRVFDKEQECIISNGIVGNAQMIIRPEHITLQFKKSKNTITGTVINKVFMGGHWLVNVHTPWGEMSVVSTDQSIINLAMGTQVALTISMDKVAFLPLSHC